MRDLLVLWDVDGTLLDADRLGTRLYEVVFAEMFGRPLTASVPKAGRTERAIIADTLALAGVGEPGGLGESGGLGKLDGPDGQLERFMAALGRRAAGLNRTELGTATGGAGPAGAEREMLGSRVRALPGAAAALAAVAGGSAAQSVLTGNLRPVAELKLAAAGLGPPLALDAGAYGDAHVVRAELVPLARAAARRVFGREFARTVLVGDTPLDVAAALASGSRAVAVTTGEYAAAELAAAGAHAVLPGLDDTAALVAAVTAPW